MKSEYSFSVKVPNHTLSGTPPILGIKLKGSEGRVMTLSEMDQIKIAMDKVRSDILEEETFFL